MDRNTDYMGIYKNITAGMKRRFLKKPNLSEGRDQFASLGKSLAQQDCPSYAGFCALAQARCEHALSNSSSEIHSLLEAARYFVKAEKQSSDVLCPSYGENLTAAINCYEHAIKVSVTCGETSLAACYCQELGAVLQEFRKPGEARIHYQRAAELHLQNPVECLQCMKKVASCKIEEGDLEGALTILTEMQYLAQERGGSENTGIALGVYAQILIHCEITRVLLLIILQPTPQRIRPEQAQTLEKYAWHNNSSSSAESEVSYIVQLLDDDLFLMLQSVVMSCQSQDVDGLITLQTEMDCKLETEQKELLTKIIQIYSTK